MWRGHMSAALVQREDLTLYMVDNWLGCEEYGSLGYGKADQADNKALAIAQTAWAASRSHVIHAPSVDAAMRFPDGSLDFVFIDANHSYAAVKEDIAVWLPKLRAGALLAGHDYGNPDYAFGAEVKRAVDEAVAEHGWTLDFGKQTTWFVRLP